MRFQAQLLRESNTRVWQIRFYVECKDTGGEIEHISHSLFMGSILSTTWGENMCRGRPSLPNGRARRAGRLQSRSGENILGADRQIYRTGRGV